MTHFLPSFFFWLWFILSAAINVLLLYWRERMYFFFCYHITWYSVLKLHTGLKELEQSLMVLIVQYANRLTQFFLLTEKTILFVMNGYWKLAILTTNIWNCWKMVEDKGISMSFIHCSQYQCTLLQIETFIQDITVSVKWKTVVTIIWNRWKLQLFSTQPLTCGLIV